MEIISIFEIESQSLFAVKYTSDLEDIFTTLFDQWQNVAYLEDFFNENIKDLTSGFFGEISVEDAVLQTLKDAKELEKQLLEVKNEKPNSKSLNSFFKPLDRWCNQTYPNNARKRSYTKRIR